MWWLHVAAATAGRLNDRSFELIRFRGLAGKNINFTFTYHTSSRGKPRTCPGTEIPSVSLIPLNTVYTYDIFLRDEYFSFVTTFVRPSHSLPVPPLLSSIRLFSFFFCLFTAYLYIYIYVRSSIPRWKRWILFPDNYTVSTFFSRDWSSSLNFFIRTQSI